ncbi:MAG: ribokinase [candidate division WOR-3 bacterium]|nr:MAG: ribokinase [candidate division WOR-3 bacterium]
MSHRPRVAVVGSLIVDLVFRADRRPGPGETFTGTDFGIYLGGKGFNQAIACRRLGAEVTLVGRVGQDHFGDMFLARLKDEGMTADHITRDEKTGTGIASPVVFPDGENSIIGVPRANRFLTPSDVDRARVAIASADILMLQLEVDPQASRHAAGLASSHGTTVMLDPAPVHLHVSIDDWPLDYLVPNEVEARILASGPDTTGFARRRVDAGLRAVVISEGRQGATIADAAGVRCVPAYRVKTVDSTGAGDAFRGGLAVSLAQGTDIDQAVRYAGACGALACTRVGAEPSMPAASEVTEFLRRTDEHSD